jgi:hypothetical protein
MIIKKMDSKLQEIEDLSSLLKEDITPNQRFLIERELKAMRKGVHGEEDSAYYIDFYLGNSKNWAIIHDLRIEYEGQIAQIDHILINRLFDLYVLESKNYSYGIKITSEGEFQAHYGRRYIGIPSPIEQNKRHIHLLERFLKGNEVLPKRIGITIWPRFKSFVLLSPKAVITRPPSNKLDTSMVIKADTLQTRLDEEINKLNPLTDIGCIGKISSSSMIEETANRLVSYHKPSTIDFKAKFGISDKVSAKPEESPTQEHKKGAFSSSKLFCAKCKKPISEKVAKYCWQNKSKFQGRAYCFDCQKNI